MSTRAEATTEVYELITQGDTSHAHDAAQAILAVEQAQTIRAEREDTYES